MRNANPRYVVSMIPRRLSQQAPAPHVSHAAAGGMRGR